MESDPTNAELENGANWISIHALRMESDRLDKILAKLLIVFLSTLSAWRATSPAVNAATAAITISIHALRMESDRNCCDNLFLTVRFLSTLSAWRAT